MAASEMLGIMCVQGAVRFPFSVPGGGGGIGRMSSGSISMRPAAGARRAPTHPACEHKGGKQEPTGGGAGGLRCWEGGKLLKKQATREALGVGVGASRAW